MTQDFNFTSRSNGGPQFYEPNWSNFMNTYNVGGRDTSGTPGPNRTYSWTITFNNYGRQQFYANVDDNGAIYINGNYEMGMGGFGTQSLVTTTNYYGPGTYTLSANANNSGGGPWGIAIDWVGYIPPPAGCTNPLASNYNSGALVDDGSCIFPSPSITYSINPSSIIQGQTATLNWSVSNSTSQSFDQGIGSVASSGSRNVTGVMNTTTYTLSATYYSYTSSSRSLTLTVYEPVVADISSSPTAIISGSSTTLQWTVTGSTSGNAIIDQGIGAVPFSANLSVSPTTTTTYTISASGPGGSDTDSTTVVVYQKPQLTVNFPTNIEYGESLSIPITYRYASSGVSIQATYTYRDANTGNTDDVTIVNYSLTGTSNDESSPALSQNWSPNIPWNGNGPLRVNFTATANGNGGSTSLSSNFYDVIVDLTPIYINIPISEDQIPADPEVVSPDADVVLSDPIIIEDVDISVEIKANKPIQVRFDDEETWNNVRQSSL